MKIRTAITVMFFNFMFVTAQEPRMERWTNFWHRGDAVGLKKLYSEDAVIFVPNGTAIRGHDSIVTFLKSGMQKSDVYFKPKDVIKDSILIFEYGNFEDTNRKDGSIIATGSYLVVWVNKNDVWRIKSHSWTKGVE